MNETIASRPLPKRPENGLLAWQATIGYLHTQYKLDSILTLHIYPLDAESAGWGAEVTWGKNKESVTGQSVLAHALRRLWEQVASRHVIFETKEALLKRPANYADHEWLDAETAAILDRLVRTTAELLVPDWRITLIYRPVESPDLRWHGRLNAVGNVSVEGQGATLRDACGGLYRGAAPEFRARSGDHHDLP